MAVLLALLWLTPSFGQEAPPAAEAAAPAASETETAPAPAETAAAEPAPPITPSAEPVQLDDVVVTTTKRPQKLRDIPQSITALNGDDLERRGVENLQDIVKLVPGVNMTNDAIAPRVTIRGISQSINTSPTTGSIFGNVSFADAYLPVTTLDVNPFDLEGVEVLKGPQGTLYGASNLNGAIRYVPKAPDLAVWEARYYGQYSQLEGDWAPSYGAVVNAPLFGRDDLALRLMAFERKQSGTVDVPRVGRDDSNALRQDGLRGMLAWKPDDWDFGFTYAHQATHSDNFAGTDNTSGRLRDGSEFRLSPQSQAYDLADLSASYDFGWAKLASESSLVNKKGKNFLEATQSVNPNSPVALASQTANETSRTWCEELRLSSPDDAAADWHWLVGALAWKETLDIDVAINIDATGANLPISLPLGALPGGLFSNQGPYLVHALSDVSAREYALFGEVTRRLWDRLEITLGGRYYRTRSGGTSDFTGAAVLTQGNPGSPLQATVEGEIPEHGFNPKAALSYHWTPGFMTYAAMSRGYRVGGVQYGVAVLPQPNSPVPEVFKSDTIWNYEAGVRTEWFQRALRFDFTGYLERWKDPQYYTLDASGTSKYLTNVGGVKSTGGEAALQFITPWGIQFSTTAAYARTVTTKPFAAPSGGTVAPGAPWPYSPKWQTASTLSYLTLLGNWSLGSGATWTYMGRAITDLTDQLPVYGYHQLDFQASVGNNAIRWLPEIDVSLNNALDKRGIVGTYYNETTRQQFSTSYIQPRTLNLRLTGHF